MLNFKSFGVTAKRLLSGMLIGNLCENSAVVIEDPLVN
jgi:hypothetical protein